jgi:DNA-binding transcriptional LysR family regulator
MQMRQIEAFRSVMLTGGVTAAASMLNISQPSVSRLIADLERQVGFDLFLRKGRRLTPTPRAQIFFEAVRRSFTGLDLLEQAARRIRAHPVGTLRVAALPALAGSIVPRAIADFQKAFPAIKVTVECSDQRGIEDRVFLGQADLGLGVWTSPKDGVQMSSLVNAEYLCVLPPSHRLAARRVVQSLDLEGESLIGPMHETDALWDAIDRTLQADGVSVNRLVETQMSYPAYCLVEAGLGVTIAEPFTAPLFAKIGLSVRRFRPPVHLRYALVEPDRLGPAPQAFVAFREAIHRAAEALMADVGRLLDPPALAAS